MNRARGKNSAAKAAALEEKLEALKRQHREIASRIQGIGFIWRGSVTRQKLTCGKKQCACHGSLEARHGPYAYWTTKVQGKTVARLLEEDEAQLLEEWIENRRKMDKAIRQMASLAKKAAPIARKLREAKNT